MSNDHIACVVIVALFIVAVVLFTKVGSIVHEEDVALPIYRQRILTGRMYWSRSYTPRWCVWAVWAVFPLFLLAIVLLN